ncbi:hypothetical protein JKP88DRAFT_339562 [Tribonema minus]|uniref:UBX domain-containing protein n=1 Tax=Tribonema minus TaxID=303371 RepID=A0A836C7L2_9STRA|nr:hypothetical protein JKP88DRAFT_339562 [Tribonema minus]
MGAADVDAALEGGVDWRLRQQLLLGSLATVAAAFLLQSLAAHAARWVTRRRREAKQAAQVLQDLRARQRAPPPPPPLPPHPRNSAPSAVAVFEAFSLSALQERHTALSSSSHLKEGAAVSAAETDVAAAAAAAATAAAAGAAAAPSRPGDIFAVHERQCADARQRMAEMGSGTPTEHDDHQRVNGQQRSQQGSRVDAAGATSPAVPDGPANLKLNSPPDSPAVKTWSLDGDIAAALQYGAGLGGVLSTDAGDGDAQQTAAAARRELLLQQDLAYAVSLEADRQRDRDTAATLSSPAGATERCNEDAERCHSAPSNGQLHSPAASISALPAPTLSEELPHEPPANFDNTHGGAAAGTGEGEGVVRVCFKCGGARIVRRFAASSRVSDLYAYVRRARLAQGRWELRRSYPQEALSDDSMSQQTIEDFGLADAVLIVQPLE